MLSGGSQWQRDREAREAQHAAKQWETAREIDALLLAAETDREAFKIIAMAKLIDSSAFDRRETSLAAVERQRQGARGNDPTWLRAWDIHERVARIAPQYVIAQAREAIALVRGWDDER